MTKYKGRTFMTAEGEATIVGGSARSTVAERHGEQRLEWGYETISRQWKFLKCKMLWLPQQAVALLECDKFITAFSTLLMAFQRLRLVGVDPRRLARYPSLAIGEADTPPRSVLRVVNTSLSDVQAGGG